MSITKAKILTAVNKRLSREETDIDQELKAVLLDTALEIDTLHSDYETNTIKGQKEYPLLDLPINEIVAVRIDKGIPLVKMGDYASYLRLVREGAAEGKPTKFHIRGNYLYLVPIPDKEYSLSISISNLGLNVDNIGLPDRYEELLIEGACAKVLSTYGLLGTQSGQTHLGLYANLLTQLSSKERANSTVGRTSYVDV